MNESTRKRLLGLVLEIGDTPEGKERIAKAFLKREVEVKKAERAIADNLRQSGGNYHSVASDDTAKVIRGRLQLSKVDSYMSGRAGGENLAKASGGDSKHKNRFGDVGAKIRMKGYKREHGETEKLLIRTAKGRLGPKGQGVRDAKKSIQQKGQSDKAANN
jgi:hypothetical protein